MNISSVNLQSFAKNNQVFSGKQKPYYGFKDKEADIKTVSADDSSDRTDRSLPMYKLGDENIKIALAQTEKRLRQTPPMQTKYFISDPIDKNRLNIEDENFKPNNYMDVFLIEQE